MNFETVEGGLVYVLIRSPKLWVPQAPESFAHELATLDLPVYQDLHSVISNNEFPLEERKKLLNIYSRLMLPPNTTLAIIAQEEGDLIIKQGLHPTQKLYFKGLEWLTVFSKTNFLYPLNSLIKNTKDMGNQAGKTPVLVLDPLPVLQNGIAIPQDSYKQAMICLLSGSRTSPSFVKSLDKYFLK